MAGLVGLVACGGPSTDPVIINDPILPGGLRIDWSFELQDGTPASCDEVSVARTLVSVGGLPGSPGAGDSFVEVDCGEPQTASFPGLLTGPRPVVLTAVGPGGEVLGEFATNVTIRSQMTAMVRHSFAFSGTGPAVGDLAVGWTIDGMDPEVRCAQVGGVTTQLQTSPGSIGDFSITLPCTEGAASFEDLRRGTYFLRLALLDADQQAVGFSEVEATVRPGEQTIARADIFVEPLAPSRVLAEWTIGGVAPETACPDLDADEVEVRLQTFDPLRLRFVETTITGTSACAGPGVALGPLSGFGRRRLAYLLVDTSLDSRITLSSTVSPTFDLLSGMTSTITVSLPTPL